MKNIGFCLTILLFNFLLFACNNTNKKIKPLKVSSLRVNKNDIVSEDSINPYKQKNHLIKNLKTNWRNTDIIKLDKLCAHSDGDLSEGLSEDVTSLFYDKLNELTGYLINYPNSCLNSTLIQGLSANFSPYKKLERPAKLLEEKKWMMKKADSLRLSKEKIKFIENIYSKVDPDVLD